MERLYLYIVAAVVKRHYNLNRSCAFVNHDRVASALNCLGAEPMAKLLPPANNKY
jgi:hypothetical protein